MTKHMTAWKKWIAVGLAAAISINCAMPVSAGVTGGFSSGNNTTETNEDSEYSEGLNEYESDVEENDDASNADEKTVSDNTDQVEIKASDKPYLALGANLTEEQKNIVLSFMKIQPSDLANYDVQYVTNQEEHEYLDSYISSDKIGTKALSSIVIAKKDKGAGLNVSTYNISYCTVGMYKNALITAGVEDADIIVAGPFPLSGTAALVGIIKAYQSITGEEMPQENVDAALNEIVVTGSIEAKQSDAVGQGEESTAEVESFMAYVKQQVAEAEGLSRGDIEDIIENAEGDFNLELTEDQIEEVAKVMEKVQKLDIDPDKLKEQAQEIYDKIQELDPDGEVRNWFLRMIDAIKEFFVNLLS